MIMGYELYRRLANGSALKNKKSKADALKCLVEPGPDIVGENILTDSKNTKLNFSTYFSG